VSSQVATPEQNALEKLMEDDPDMVADKIGRAYGVLRHSFIIDSKEALNLLSLLRLGGNLGFFPRETVNLCDSLLMDIQQAHLQLHAGMKLSPEHRDSIRAEILRSRLQSLNSPDNFSSNHKTDRPDVGGNPD
jgi:protein arginine kinase